MSRLTPETLAYVLAHVERGTTTAEQAESIRGHIAALALECGAAQERIRLDLEHDAQLRKDLGARPDETLRGVAMRVLQERDAASESAKREISQRLLMEQERDELRQRAERAEADNAALLTLLQEWHDWGMGAGALSESLDPLYSKSCEIRAQPHPGTALLEEHRKAIEPLRAIVDGLASEMEAAILERERPKGGMSVPFHGDFANAPSSMLGRLRWWTRELRGALSGNVSGLLARARNEGLERAAQALLAKRDAILRGVKPGTRKGGLEEAASIVRAMKEPEQ